MNDHFNHSGPVAVNSVAVRTNQCWKIKDSYDH